MFFNTTVHAGNFEQIAALTAFFVAHADGVRFASFQLQAGPGRGILGARAALIDNDSDNHSVAHALQQGAGIALKLLATVVGTRT